MTIFDDIRPNSFYQEFAEPEPDDREPLTPDEEWEQWKFIDNILNQNN